MTRTLLGSILLPLLLFAEGSSGKDLLREKAAGGDAEAAFYLGNEYFYGENRPKNDTLAAYWYKKAAEAGIPEAQFNYASCLEAGRGVQTAIADAFAWYRKSADGNFPPALFRVAKFYQTGIQDEKGITQLHPSGVTAREMLEKLAEHAYEPAELELAAQLMRKEASKQDHIQAYKILSGAAKRREASPAVYRMLADCYYAGFGCKADSEKMLQLLRLSAEKGDPEALAKLGFLHEYGRVAKQDAVLAREYYRKAAKAGHPMAQFKYAEAISEGVYADLTSADALKWYKKSAENQCPQALFKLGVIYYEGNGVKKNMAMAGQYFFDAAKRGYVRAQYNLACLFDSGEISGKADREAAFYWFLQAAQNGDSAAQKRVADCYLNGIGVERSITQAEKWLRKLAAAGDWSAKRKLLEIEQITPTGSLL